MRPARPSTRRAKLLGLPYPGGPELAQLAAAGRPGQYSFPRPMLDRPGFEFSFSGLKTAVMQAVRAGALSDAGARRLAHAVQDAIVATLCAKALRALEFTGHRALVVAGGVGANRELRARLTARGGGARGAGLFPAARVLHRQRGDDRGGGPAAAARGRAHALAASRCGRAGRCRSCAPPADDCASGQRNG